MCFKRSKLRRGTSLPSLLLQQYPIEASCIAMSSVNVLVGNDEPRIRQTITQSLKPFDCIIALASTAKEAFQQLEDRSYQLVLLDFDLLGNDVFTVLAQTIARQPSAQVIMISASATNSDIIRALKLGAADFLQKPLDTLGLQKAIGRVLEDSVEEEHFSVKSTADLYEALLAGTQHLGGEGHIVRAIACAVRVIKLDPFRPEGFNLLGELEEMLGETLEGQKYFRVALALDPAYKPAQDNLHRTVQQPLAAPFQRPNLAE